MLLYITRRRHLGLRRRRRRYMLHRRRLFYSALSRSPYSSSGRYRCAARYHTTCPLEAGRGPKVAHHNHHHHNHNRHHHHYHNHLHHRHFHDRHRQLCRHHCVITTCCRGSLLQIYCTIYIHSSKIELH